MDKKQFFSRLASSLAIGVCFALPGMAKATEVLQNGYVRAGVSDYGTLGSNGNASPGILYDATGSSNYGVNDFLTPGSPFEGFYLTGRSYSQYSNNSSAGTFSWLLESLGGSSVKAIGTATDGSIEITNLYTLTTLGGQSVIDITTTLRNLSDTALYSLQFLRTLDPDPDVNAFGSYYTKNAVLSDNQACGTGVQTGQTICAYSFSSIAHKAGVSRVWSTSPGTYLNGVNDGDGDYAIGVAFDLGDLGVEGTIELKYGYALGASLGDATGTVAEPGSLLLLGVGVAGLGVFRRRKVTS